MISAHEILEMLSVLWLLVGGSIAAVVVCGCVGNISDALRGVIGNAVNFVMMCALVVVVLAWVVVTGPAWMIAIALVENDRRSDDDNHERQW
jgi:ABC-type proline/glycine betaine transport system permease subunit